MSTLYYKVVDLSTVLSYISVNDLAIIVINVYEAPHMHRYEAGSKMYQSIKRDIDPSHGYIKIPEKDFKDTLRAAMRYNTHG